MTFLLKRKLATAVCTVVIGGAFAPAAMAWYCPPPEPGKVHCNAGRGNGSEGCDPGNSSTSPTGDAGQNQGGDEGGPIQGGTGAP